MPKAEGKAQELRNNFISGSIGGFVGTALNTPVDVFKSRVREFISIWEWEWRAYRCYLIITENTNYEKGQKKPWTVQGVYQIGKTEGLSGLYKGFTPKVLRLAPGGGVLLLVVEVVLEQYRKFLGPPYL